MFSMNDMGENRTVSNHAHGRSGKEMRILGVVER